MNYAIMYLFFVSGLIAYTPAMKVIKILDAILYKKRQQAQQARSNKMNVIHSYLAEEGMVAVDADLHRRETMKKAKILKEHGVHLGIIRSVFSLDDCDFAEVVRYRVKQ